MKIKQYKMNTNISNKSNLGQILILSFLFVLLNCTLVHANLLHEETKTINKSFKITKTGTLNVDNRYGNLTVESWDKDEISFQINIKVSSSSKSKAKEAIDNLSITFSSTSQEVSAVTELGNSNDSGFFSWFSNSNISYKINYIIKCPKSLEANLSNKYGNIKLPDWTGNTVINLGYGNLYAGNLAARNKLFLSYGKFDISRTEDLFTVIKYSDGTLGSAKIVDMQISYTDININDVSKLTGSSKYSELKIANIGVSANLKTGYDEYEFGNVGSLVVTGNYTDISISSLNGDYKSNLSYGGVNIKNVEASTKSIIFDGKYTNFALRGLTNYNLNFDGRYATPKLPAAFKYSFKDKNGSTFKCEGQDGNGRTNVVVTSSYGDLSIF